MIISVSDLLAEAVDYLEEHIIFASCIRGKLQCHWLRTIIICSRLRWFLMRLASDECIRMPVNNVYILLSFS